MPVLEFIHQRGVIHRDIKPPNIMRRQSDGKYVLIDFGASKQLKSTVVAGQGTQIGTNGYSPFEQMKRGEAYPASDLYSLGVTCFYLLTGQDPFALFLDQGYGWVDSWRKHLLQPLSEQLQQVFDNLLQKESQNRYQKAGELLKDLLAEVNPQSPRQLTSPLKSQASQKSGLIAGLLLLLGMGGYGIMHFRSQPNDQRVDETVEQVSTSDILSSGESTLTLLPSEIDIESVLDLSKDSGETPVPQPAPPTAEEAPRDNGSAENPAAEESEPVPAEASSSSVSSLKHKLVGILELGDRSVPLFEVDGIPRRVNIGETLGSSGWSLVEVKDGEAIIRRNGEVRSIYTGQSF